jgi:hypothetical protein
MKTFTIKFDVNKADEIVERFEAYFWDGGFDQYLEGDFFNQFGSNCDEYGVYLKVRG